MEELFKGLADRPEQIGHAIQDLIIKSIIGRGQIVTEVTLCKKDLELIDGLYCLSQNFLQLKMKT
jgi:hypothetical protein